jgi:hypothetical protein
MFGIPMDAVRSGDIKIEKSVGYLLHRNRGGGGAFFLPKATPDLFETVLKQVLPIRDVEFRKEMGRWRKAGRTLELTYIHKFRAAGTSTSSRTHRKNGLIRRWSCEAGRNSRSGIPTLAKRSGQR